MKSQDPDPQQYGRDTLRDYVLANRPTSPLADAMKSSPYLSTTAQAAMADTYVHRIRGVNGLAAQIAKMDLPAKTQLPFSCTGTLGLADRLAKTQLPSAYNGTLLADRLAKTQMPTYCGIGGLADLIAKRQNPALSPVAQQLAKRIATNTEIEPVSPSGDALRRLAAQIVEAETPPPQEHPKRVRRTQTVRLSLRSDERQAFVAMSETPRMLETVAALLEDMVRRDRESEERERAAEKREQAADARAARGEHRERWLIVLALVMPVLTVWLQHAVH